MTPERRERLSDYYPSLDREWTHEDFEQAAGDWRISSANFRYPAVWVNVSRFPGGWICYSHRRPRQWYTESYIGRLWLQAKDLQQETCQPGSIEQRLRLNMNGWRVKNRFLKTERGLRQSLSITDAPGRFKAFTLIREVDQKRGDISYARAFYRSPRKEEATSIVFIGDKVLLMVS